MSNTIDTNPSSLEAENDKLKLALRSVFTQNKRKTQESEALKIENEKLNSAIRKQIISIPEIQIQNRVLQQQLKIMVQDLHQSEKNQSETFENLKIVKQKLLSKIQQLRWTRTFLFMTFLSMIGLVYLSYRDKETNQKTLLIVNKINDENESLIVKNKMLFDEHESFRDTINKKYQDQIRTLTNNLDFTTKEKLELHSNLSQTIENFKLQKNDLIQEHDSLTNLVKNNYENKVARLTKEKEIISNHLMVSEAKSREIILYNPSLNEPRHAQYISALHNETKENLKNTPDQKLFPKAKSPTLSELEKEQELLPFEEPKASLELNKNIPFKIKTSPF